MTRRLSKTGRIGYRRAEQRRRLPPQALPSAIILSSSPSQRKAHAEALAAAEVPLRHDIPRIKRPGACHITIGSPRARGRRRLPNDGLGPSAVSRQIRRPSFDSYHPRPRPRLRLSSRSGSRRSAPVWPSARWTLVIPRRSLHCLCARRRLILRRSCTRALQRARESTW